MSETPSAALFFLLALPGSVLFPRLHWFWCGSWCPRYLVSFPDRRSKRFLLACILMKDNLQWANMAFSELVRPAHHDLVTLCLMTKDPREQLHLVCNPGLTSHEQKSGFQERCGVICPHASALGLLPRMTWTVTMPFTVAYTSLCVAFQPLIQTSSFIRACTLLGVYDGDIGQERD